MSPEDRAKVIGHALDHVAYRWEPCLPVRHDRRGWTAEEKKLYAETFRQEEKTYRVKHPFVCGCGKINCQG